ncbi:MAG TPA: iron-containing redox enzyme family protein, partial [Blastocatellia bacterium]
SSLSADPAREGLIAVLDDLKHNAKDVSIDGAATLLGQWYHPVNYFPEFLSRLISVSPLIETQTSICGILWQELGEGDPAAAHTALYVDTMESAGFARDTVAGSSPAPYTAELVDAYRKSSYDPITGLGFLYGTEVADLPMVSAVGHLVRTCTGKKEFPWVDIHVKQEPDHVKSSSRALLPSFTKEEEARIVGGARELWMLWTGFFQGVKKTILN